MANNWRTGNATDKVDQYRGWLLGHFIDPREGPRSTETLEVKWGVHPAGASRAEWATGEQRTTLVILVSGRHRIDLSVGTTVLTQPGDYVLWEPGIEHSWEAEKDSVVLTVRWPSLVK